MGVVVGPRTARACLLLLGGASAAVADAAARQEPADARIRMEVAATEIHLGDPLAVTLTVEHPEGWTVAWPDSLDVAPFEALRYDRGGEGQASPRSSDRTASAASAAITAFELGELEIPSIAVTATSPDGATRTLRTDPFAVGVVSVGLDDSGEARDVKGPLAIPRDWRVAAAWAALALAVAAAAAVGARRMLRPRAERVDVANDSKPPPRPFHELALEALDALEASSLLERDRIEEYHVRISEIVRSYVEGQFRVRALELATSEVVDGLRAVALGAAVASRFGSFLGRCDLVKFAKARPTRGECRELMRRARDLVRDTSVGREASAAEPPSGAATADARKPAATRPPGEDASPRASSDARPRDEGSPLAAAARRIR